MRDALHAVDRKPSQNKLLRGPYDGRFDAITGQRLCPKLIEAGRALEMKFLKDWKVYEYAEYAECKESTGRAPIST